MPATSPAVLTELPPGESGLLSARPGPDLAAAGYREREYLLAGTACAYRGDLPFDGRADLAVDDDLGAAEFTTRVVVRAPEGDAPSSGVLVVEWLNVSSGADAAPDWTYLSEELLRRGHAWAGVSAQHVGVEGGGGALSIAGAPSPGLRGNDSERYGPCHHPGDAYALDIYTQALTALRAQVGAAHVLAIGESQAACTLTTYATGVQPLTGAADGFLLHSRPAAAAPLGRAGEGLAMAEVLQGPPVRVREDLAVPVLVVVAEGDLFDRIAFLPARQPDAERVRTWEVAGSAHADRFMIDFAEPLLECEVPVNAGQQWAVIRAALRALERWVCEGTPAPAAPPIETDEAAEDAVRDEHGLARGGLRTPVVAAPTERLSGRAWPGASIACSLFGSTTPLAAPAFTDTEAYLAAYEAATDAGIEAGHLLAEDRDALLAEARPDLIS